MSAAVQPIFPDEPERPGPPKSGIDGLADGLYATIVKYIDRRLEQAHERALKHHHPQHPQSERDFADLRQALLTQEDTITALTKRLRILEQRLALVESGK